MAIEAEVKFIHRHLVRTMDKPRFLRKLRHMRMHSVDPVEADLLTELIAEVDSGDYDG